MHGCPRNCVATLQAAEIGTYFRCIVFEHRQTINVTEYLM
jgi:hypothetical protein